MSYEIADLYNGLMWGLYMLGACATLVFAKDFLDLFRGAND